MLDRGYMLPNYQGKRRRSTAGAQGTNTGHEDGEAMASVGVRLTAQLGDSWARCEFIAWRSDSERNIETIYQQRRYPAKGDLK